jgi:hypothetical protein
MRRLPLFAGKSKRITPSVRVTCDLRIVASPNDSFSSA